MVWVSKSFTPSVFEKSGSEVVNRKGADWVMSTSFGSILGAGVSLTYASNVQTYFGLHHIWVQRALKSVYAKKLKLRCESGRSTCATEMLPTSSTVPPPWSLTSSVALTVIDGVDNLMMKRVSQRVRAMTPRLRKGEIMSQIRIVRSLVQKRLSLHTRRLATQTVNALRQEGPRKRNATGGTETLRAPRQ